MPILTEESDKYPDRLLEDDGPAIDPGRLWWCFHVKPRQEKALARELRLAGLWYYLPQVTRDGITPRGRKIRSCVPLFPNYVFVLCTDGEWPVARENKRVVRPLKVVDQEELEQDLRRVHKMLRAGLPVSPASRYPVGSQVRILSGPLEGLTGTVVRQDDGDRFVASVRFIRAGASIELRGWQVELIA